MVATATAALAQRRVVERADGSRIAVVTPPRPSPLAEAARHAAAVGRPLPLDPSSITASEAGYFLDSLRFEEYDAGGAGQFSLLEAFAETADGAARIETFISDTYRDGVRIHRYGRRDSTYNADGRYTVTYFELDTLTGTWVGDYTATYSRHPDSGDHVITNEPIDDPFVRISSSHLTFDTIRGIFPYDLRRKTRRGFFSRDTLFYDESFDELEADRDRFTFSGFRSREERTDPWNNAYIGANYYTGEPFAGSYRRADTTYLTLSRERPDAVGSYEVRRGASEGRTRVDTSVLVSRFPETRYERLSHLTLNGRGLTVRDSTLGREVTIAGDTTTFTTVDEYVWLPDAERLLKWTRMEIVDGEYAPDFIYRFYYSPVRTSTTSETTADARACEGLRLAPRPGGHAIHLALPTDVHSAHARLIDLAGRTVAELHLRDTETQVPLPSALAPGLYAVEVTHARGRCARVVPVY